MKRLALACVAAALVYVVGVQTRPRPLRILEDGSSGIVLATDLSIKGAPIPGSGDGLTIRRGAWSPSGAGIILHGDGNLEANGEIIAVGCTPTSRLMPRLTLSSEVQAAPVDRRAAVTIQASPRERYALLFFMRGESFAGEAQDHAQRVRVALDLREVARIVADLQARGKLTDDAFVERPRRTFSIARDDLDGLVKLLNKAMSGALSEVLTPWRQELEEVLAGRNPYGATKLSRD